LKLIVKKTLINILLLEHNSPRSVFFVLYCNSQESKFL